MNFTRKLGALLMLACAAVQPAAASAPLASALALALHRGDHAHSVAVVPEDGHLHIVLSHGQGDGHQDEGVSHSGHALTSYSADHVFHLAEADSATIRRAALDPAPPLAMAAALPLRPAPLVVVRPRPEPRARGADPLSTVVLRL